MSNRHSILILFSALAVATSGLAQVLPQSLPHKVVVYDMGGQWPAALVAREDGTVDAIGNPWFGGGQRTLPASGIVDLARLDALAPGEPESVALIGSGGLTMLTWNTDIADFDTHLWPSPQLAGARGVRCTPFGNQHFVLVLGADGRTLYCFRHHGAFGDGFLVTSFTVASPVLDFDAFQHQNGTARLLLVTADGLTCTQLNGSPLWTLPGVGGDVLRCPVGATTKALWLHRDVVDGKWQLARIGDDDVLGVDGVATLLATDEQLVGASALDCDGDGDLDLVVKTSAGVSMWLQPPSGNFGEAGEVSFDGADGSTCVPDVIGMHAGERTRLVDVGSSGGLDWSNLSLSAQPPHAGIDQCGIAIAEAAAGDCTRIDFSVSITEEWLAKFAAPQKDTHLQVVTWLQQEPTPEGRLDEKSEDNRLHLMGTDVDASGDSQWSLDMALHQTFVSQVGWGPNADVHYWVTLRLVMTDVGSTVPESVSDPVTFAVTLSNAQMTGEAKCEFLLGYCAPGTTFEQLPKVYEILPDPSFGGSVVGVITRITLPPPPPPPPGLPTPSEAHPGDAAIRLGQ